MYSLIEFKVKFWYEDVLLFMNCKNKNKSIDYGNNTTRSLSQNEGAIMDLRRWIYTWVHIMVTTDRDGN